MGSEKSVHHMDLQRTTRRQTFPRTPHCASALFTRLVAPARIASRRSSGGPWVTRTQGTPRSRAPAAHASRLLHLRRQKRPSWAQVGDAGQVKCWS
jgi:hypothetical protein